MLKTTTKFYRKEGMIYIPKNLLEDSQFPITGTLVSIEIKEKQIIITEAETEDEMQT